MQVKFKVLTVCRPLSPIQGPCNIPWGINEQLCDLVPVFFEELRHIVADGYVTTGRTRPPSSSAACLR